MKHLSKLLVITLILMGLALAGCRQTEDKPKPEDAPKAPAAQAQPVGGGGVVGTTPINMNIPPATLILDRVGQVKGGPGKLEVKDRQYEGTGAFPFTLNGSAFTAPSLKVISNMKIQADTGQHQGTIDVDIDLLPTAGHLTLQYNGNASMTDSTITSNGTFKTVKATGIFAGVTGSGSYSMTIVETAQTLGATATVGIITTTP